MYGISRFAWLFPAWLLIGAACLAEEDPIVDHFDPIVTDPGLTLTELVDFTLENYPDGALFAALKEEAEALQRRGDSWIAGALNAGFFYRDSWVSGAESTGAPEISGEIEVPLWNWGQRSAGQQLAKNAQIAGELQIKTIRLQVAGLVRNALWELALVDNRHEMTKQVYEVSEQLVKTVKRRVELGDLPRADLLLAESEHLAVRSDLVRAEAEQMHARKRFATLTQSTRIPSDFSETRSSLSDIKPEHPSLDAANALLERKRAELEWIKSAGSGQPSIALGANSQRGANPHSGVETLTVALNVPFGGGAHRAPEISAANLELTEALTRRDHIFRNLTQALHEAKHALEVDRTELEIASQRRDIAEAHLKMTRLSFNAGEINLLDLLKIQSRAHEAIRAAEERKIILQRDIALYNQVLGVLP
ncbi:MAG: TolC family protein [Gammaproteobacteria bacterium]